MAIQGAHTSCLDSQRNAKKVLRAKVVSGVTR